MAGTDAEAEMIASQSTLPHKDDTSVSQPSIATNSSPTKLHQAVADLARAYMEEMRDDVAEDPRESSHNIVDPIQPAPSAIAELNIQEIISNVAKSHSISTASINTAKEESKDESNTSHHSFPSGAVVENPNNDEIISRFGNILVSGTNDTESISELGTIIEARGVMSSLKTELMSWTETGCCISPSSLRGGKFEFNEEEEDEETCSLVDKHHDNHDREDGNFNIDVVQTDSIEKSKGTKKENIQDVIEAEDDFVEEDDNESIVAEMKSSEEEEGSVEDASAMEEDEGSVEEACVAEEDVSVQEDMEDAPSEFPAVDRYADGTEDDNGLCTVESDQTAPTNNFEASMMAESVRAVESADHSVDCQDELVDEMESPETDEVAAAEEEFGEEIARCASPSADTQESVTSTEVAALIASIKNESLSHETSVQEPSVQESSFPEIAVQEEVRCTSPSTETEESATSADIGALIARIKQESPVKSDKSMFLEEAAESSVKSQVSSASSKGSNKKSHVSKGSIQSQANDGTSEIIAFEDNAVDENTDNTIEGDDSRTEDKQPESADDEATPEPMCTEQTNMPALVVETSNFSPPYASILRPSSDIPAEAVLSPHSEASAVTNITSNQTPTPVPGQKTVHWSSSLGALSSEGDFATGTSNKSITSDSSASTDITRERTFSDHTGDREPSVPQMTSTPLDPFQTYKKQIDSFSGSLEDLTEGWVSKIKKDWHYVNHSSISSMKEDILSWTESGACLGHTPFWSPPSTPSNMLSTPQEGNADIPNTKENEATDALDRDPSGVSVEGHNVESTCLSPRKNSIPTLGTIDEHVESTRSCSPIPVVDSAQHFLTNVGFRLSPRSAEEHGRTMHLHEDVYKERDFLREWKLDAEETMQCQDTVTGLLREQKASLVKQCSELERAMKDLKEWKFDSSEELRIQSAQLEELLAQKSELIKRCEENQELIQELTNWKVAAEDALATREAELEKTRRDNSTLSEECLEQRAVIKDLTEWKIESTETMKNQKLELVEVHSRSVSLTTQCKNYEDSIHQLTSWKSDVEPVMESHVVELKQLKDDNAALTSKCDDQQISIDKLNRWKINAEEEMKMQLSMLEMFEKTTSNLTAECDEHKKCSAELAKWKSDAEDTIKKQILTIGELIQWKDAAENKERELYSQLESLEEEKRKLVEQCDEYRASINELMVYKVEAEKNQERHLAEIESLKTQIAAPRLENEKALEELTRWKAEAQEKMENKEAELNELQSHYLIFGKQCKEQKEIIEQKEEEFINLTDEIAVASKKISRLEKDNVKQEKKIKSFEEIVQTKTNEVAELKAMVAKLQDELENDDKPYKQEMSAAKIAHHKELMVLKTERHMLASKIDKLVNKNQDLQSRVTTLNTSMEELENKYDFEKERHQESKVAVRKLEKALKVRVLLILTLAYSCSELHLIIFIIFRLCVRSIIGRREETQTNGEKASIRC
eukprot:scaffold919_cov74-Cyclotella_meneghiniana.AAC.3